MNQPTKPEPKLFAVIEILPGPGLPLQYQAVYNSQIQVKSTAAGGYEVDLNHCPTGTQRVIQRIKATDAAQIMKLHVTTVRRQAERAWCRKNGVPTQYEREKPYRDAQQETRRRALALGQL